MSSKASFTLLTNILVT